MKKQNRINLKKMIKETFEINKVYSDPRAKAFKTEQAKINENLSFVVNAYTSVRLLDDNSVGIFDKDKMVIRFTDTRSVDKLMLGLSKIKKRM